MEGNGIGMQTMRQKKKVMLFCDGTWCGQLTGTNTNVKILADAVAGYTVKTRTTFKNEKKGIVGQYFDGEGVQGSFADYILDGALGGKIKQDCLEAYRFVMDEFEKSEEQCEAWLVGLSRGSYTVRCVAGMINNCGLISRRVVTNRFAALGRHVPPSELEMDDVIETAYRYYRDRSSAYIPTSDYMRQWKVNHSLPTDYPPVKLMALFETVGALGIPSLNPGSGVDYYGELNFFGKAEEGASAVSGEVERVYQALAVHDRCSVFSPCHIKRDKQNDDFSYNKEKPRGHDKIRYVTEELWFPGQHYDLGRQKFMFYKSPPLLPPEFRDLKLHELIKEISSRFIERSVSFLSSRVLRIPEIHPNTDYSNLVLEWVMKKMADTDPAAFNTLPSEVDTRVVVTQESLWERLFDVLTIKPKYLESDAYDRLVDDAYLKFDLLPFAHRFLVGLFNRYLLMDRTIMQPLTALEPPVRFRQGPVGDREKYLKASKTSLSTSSSSGLTYRSRSYDAYKLECFVLENETTLVDE